MRFKVFLFKQSFPVSILHMPVKKDKYVDSGFLGAQDILFKERFNNSLSQYHEDVVYLLFISILH